MGAMSEDKKTQYTEGVELAAPVGVSKKIYAGSLVVLDGSTKHAEEASDASGKVFHGVAMEQADNSLGLGGAINIRVRRRGLFLFKIAAATQADVGKPAFALYGDEVALSTGVSNGIMVGQIAALESATKVWIDISFALNPTDVATHLADTSGAHAASAISQADAGNYFPAATDTVEEALQALAKGPHFLTLPRCTGWTKDGAAHAIALPAVESPVPVRIKRAYANLGTAPGSGKTLALTVNGSALLSIAESATQGEAEALDIAIAADTDIVISANETASGTGANCDLILVLYPDDGE